MGTPDFALCSLKALVENDYTVIGAVTQPDKPKGRKMILTLPPVKVYALENNIPVYQPQSLRNDDFRKLLEEINPDLIVLAAYGKILPDFVLEYPKYGCINVHASILPFYRGAAPINAAVINGETESGVTIMQMDGGIDTGDILLCEKVEIGERETAGELHDKLAALGGMALVKALTLLEKGALVRIKQDNSKASSTKKIDDALCKIDFSDSAKNIVNKIRGLSPAPGAYSYLDRRRIKLFDARINKETSDQTAVFGGIIGVEKNFLTIKAADYAVDIYSVQAEGSKLMPAGDFLRGNKIVVGMIFGVKDE